jgi:hypothetical protein
MNPPRWSYVASAIGAAAYIDRIDSAAELSHRIPVQSASAVGLQGGLSESRVHRYEYRIETPIAVRAFAADSLQTFAEGTSTDYRGLAARAGAIVRGLELIERIQVPAIEVELVAHARIEDHSAKMSARRTVLEGLRLDGRDVRILWREDLLQNLHLAKKQDSLIRAIQISGAAPADFVIERNAIRWPGVGRIILGEVGILRGECRVTMLRAELGSLIGGWATVAEVRCSLLPGDDPTPPKG